MRVWCVAGTDHELGTFLRFHKPFSLPLNDWGQRDESRDARRHPKQDRHPKQGRGIGKPRGTPALLQQGWVGVRRKGAQDTEKKK